MTRMCVCVAGYSHFCRELWIDEGGLHFKCTAAHATWVTNSSICGSSSVHGRGGAGEARPTPVVRGQVVTLRHGAVLHLAGDRSCAFQATWDPPPGPGAAPKDSSTCTVAGACGGTVAGDAATSGGCVPGLLVGVGEVVTAAGRPNSSRPGQDKLLHQLALWRQTYVVADVLLTYACASACLRLCVCGAALALTA